MEIFVKDPNLGTLLIRCGNSPLLQQVMECVVDSMPQNGTFQYLLKIINVFFCLQKKRPDSGHATRASEVWVTLLDYCFFFDESHHPDISITTPSPSKSVSARPKNFYLEIPYKLFFYNYIPFFFGKSRTRGVVICISADQWDNKPCCKFHFGLGDGFSDKIIKIFFG